MIAREVRLLGLVRAILIRHNPYNKRLSVSVPTQAMGLQLLETRGPSDFCVFGSHAKRIEPSQRFGRQGQCGRKTGHRLVSHAGAQKTVGWIR